MAARCYKIRSPVPEHFTLMRILLFISSGGSFLIGFTILESAKSAIHEIEAFLLFLIGATLLVGAAILAAIFRARKQLEEVIVSKMEGVIKQSASLSDAGEVSTAKRFETLIEYVGLNAANTAKTVNLLKSLLPTLAENVASQPAAAVVTQKVVTTKPYFYSLEGGQSGPFSSEEVRELRASGVINDTTLIFKNGDTEWRKFSEFSEFAP